MALDDELLLSGDPVRALLKAPRPGYKSRCGGRDRSYAIRICSDFLIGRASRQNDPVREARKRLDRVTALLAPLTSSES